jgi:hypothetical protein
MELAFLYVTHKTPENFACLLENRFEAVAAAGVVLKNQEKHNSLRINRNFSSLLQRTSC